MKIMLKLMITITSSDSYVDHMVGSPYFHWVGKVAVVDVGDMGAAASDALADRVVAESVASAALTVAAVSVPALHSVSVGFVLRRVAEPY